MKFSSLCLALAGMALFGQGAPETKPSSLEDELLALLNTPVQGASKRQQRSVDSPQAIEVITGAELRQMGITRLQDAFRIMTSVDVIQAGNGATALGMRGVMQDGQPRTVQILIDGAPMYNVLGGGADIDNLPVPIDVIERIEVVRGPSSTLYGADAVVGVISIITRKPEAGVHGGLRASAANLGTSRGGATLQYGGGAFSVTGGYDGASTGLTGQTLPALGNPATLTTYDANHSDAMHQDKYFARADATLGEAGVWVATGASHKQMGPESGFHYRTTDFTYVQGGWHQAWTPDFSTEVRIHQVDQSMTFSPQPNLAVFFGDPRFNSDYKWFDTRTTLLEFQGNWTATPDVHVVFGADRKKGQAFGPVTFIGINEAVVNDLYTGGFLSVDWDLTPTLALSAGARAENESLGGSRTSPRLALVWKAGGNRVFRAAFLTSTRSPQIAETQPDFQNGTGLIVDTPYGPLPLEYQLIPNPALKPEKTVNYEVGYRDRLGAVSVDFTLFRMKLQSLIFQASLPPTIDPSGPTAILPNQYQNGGDATDQGFEATVNWLVAANWNVGLNGTVLDMKRDAVDPNNPLEGGRGFSYAPKVKVNLYTRFKQGRFSGYLAERYVDATNVEALVQEGSPHFDTRPAYFQTDLNLGYEVVPGCTVSLYARDANRSFQPQGTTGMDRPEVYYTVGRETGLMVRYLF